MIISFQGYGHFNGEKQLNNQDFGYTNDRILLITDGCSGCIHSEVGTRLFVQLFTQLADFENPDMFEENVSDIFENMVSLAKMRCTDKAKIEEFIMNNYLFTILACFKTDEGYTIKFFGDGYIITQNIAGNVSYIRFNYGKYPPYYAYTYCPSISEERRKSNFKTIKLRKEDFSAVGIGTDGCAPFARGDVADIDSNIICGMDKSIEGIIRMSYKMFYDDVTIAVFDGDGKEIHYNSEPNPVLPVAFSRPSYTYSGNDGFDDYMLSYGGSYEIPISPKSKIDSPQKQGVDQPLKIAEKELSIANNVVIPNPSTKFESKK